LIILAVERIWTASTSLTWSVDARDAATLQAGAPVQLGVGGGAGRRAAHSGGTAQARGRRTAWGRRRQEGGAQRRDGVDRRAAHGDGGGAARTAVAARS
jgi:hypothetical protein